MRARRGVARPIAVALFALVGLALSAGASGAEAQGPPTLWTGCPSGSGAGQCSIPRGIAADPTSGDLYLADSLNNRIDEFSIWGAFVKAWGWGVNDGSPELQSCGPTEPELEPEPGLCRAGDAGGGAGQLNTEAEGVAVDESGDVYVVDQRNHRVEKFDPTAGVGGDEAEFVSMSGGEVNRTKVEAGGASEAEENLCPVDPGDVCQAGSTGTGSGQFAEPAPGAEVGSFIAIAPGSGGETVYVGDVGRVQEFDTGGEYLGDLPDPEGLFAEKLAEDKNVRALAADAAGNLYLSFTEGEHTEAGVLKLNDEGEELCRAESAPVEPRAIAADAAGNFYIASGRKSVVTEIEFRRFGPNCAGTSDSSFPFHDGFDQTTGIATSEACGLESADLYVGNATEADSFVRAYGPPPDPTVCEPPRLAPDVGATFATAVGSVDATVQAQINSHFWEGAAYHVEYGTGRCDEGGCTSTALPSGPLGGGAQNAPIPSERIPLDGLLPQTTYHFRFVAENHFGAGEDSGPVVGEEASFTTYPPPPSPKTDCPNQAFRGGPSAFLPDCRAFELVSPVDKDGGSIAVLGSDEVVRPARLDQAAVDGGLVTYSSQRAFGAPTSAPYTSQYLSARGAGGWSTEAITPPQEGIEPLESRDAHYKAFTEDLCSGWTIQGGKPLLAPGAIAEYPNLYRRQNCGAGTGGFEALSTAEPKVDPSEFGSGQAFQSFPPTVKGISADGSLAVFASPGALTASLEEVEEGKATTEASLYAHTRGATGLVAICVLPNGSTYPGECVLGSGTSGKSVRGDSVFNAVSIDGRRVFWSAAKSGEGKIYLRANPTAAKSASAGCEADRACTVALSTGQSFFWGAAADGTRAIYSEGSLKDNEGEADLWEAEVEETGGGLSVHRHRFAREVGGVVGMSEDASRVYLVSREALTATPNSEGKSAVPGALNLFLYRAPEEGKAASFAFLGTLSGADRGGGEEGAASEEPYLRVSRVSADGMHVAFMSRASLTGFDNTDQASGEADSEVYLYDAADARLTCVSCNPAGARPAGRIIQQEGIVNGPIAAQIPGWEYNLHASRVLSDDGNRLFFESFEPLVLRDTNGTQDVYEWERGGSSQAGCEALGAELYVSASAGCLSLISSGQSPSDSAFVDASADGRDVFFTTASSLLPQDPGLVDVYDAREGGGFPQPTQAAACEGEACQSPRGGPEDPTPASAAFEGPGNAKARKSRRCPKAKRLANRAGNAHCARHHRRHADHHSNGRAAK